MKNLLTFLTFFLLTIATAQEIPVEKTHEFSYGVIIGSNFYNISNNSTIDSYVTKNITPSIVYGGYGEYNFTKNIGVKLDAILYNKKFLYFTKNQTFKMSFVDISTNFKYNFGDTYRKGFYLLGGPKLSIITKVNSDDEDVKHHFETVNLGFQLGFGLRVYRFIDVQAKLEYEVTPFFKLENGHSSKFVNGIVSANIDLTRLSK